MESDCIDGIDGCHCIRTAQEDAAFWEDLCHWLATQTARLVDDLTGPPPVPDAYRARRAPCPLVMRLAPPYPQLPKAR